MTIDTTCPKCGSLRTVRRKGFHFDHEYRCPDCNHIWEPKGVKDITAPII